MFLHIGSDFLINDKDIIGIFDLENTTRGTKTKDFLSHAEKEGNVITIGDDIPRSFIIVQLFGEIRIYLSPISSITLKKRIEDNS